ncbi:hypothetical protein PVAND_015655 [Polypedilum vanderplanki]|uniref:Elongation of very long chain fatty acids protein n=1 Tax=Polypedilum vanderplanki TaxID=319348 RepID=A0A9J6BDT4_POLVA|nr:hypothetical protein PVAND_015655 [Polypedilum vanderplanki]
MNGSNLISSQHFVTNVSLASSAVRNVTLDNTKNGLINLTGASFGEIYNLFYDYADPRMRDRFLMGKPHWIILIYIFYVIIITHTLPNFMRNRKPYDFQRISLYIDSILLLIAMFFCVITVYSWIFLFNWRCQVIDRSDDWHAQMAVEFCWLYLMTRFIYTLHSVPFVLSKRKSSLANYLIIHHAVFPIMVWTFINFYPGGHITFGGMINSVTHVGLFGIKFVILYLPNVKKYRRQFHVFMHSSIRPNTPSITVRAFVVDSRGENSLV